jgi:uncharacterized delta-60 repeat protein
MRPHIGRVARKAIILIVLLELIGVTIAFAVGPGDPDSSFSGDGLVTMNLGLGYDDGAHAVTMQGDKILAAGEDFDSANPYATSHALAFARYLSNGTPDPAFADGDGTHGDALGTGAGARGVVVQPDGKIVASGSMCAPGGTNCDLFVIRYNADIPPPDTVDLFQAVDVGGADNGTHGGLILRSNGKFLIAGYMWNGSDYDFAVYRLNSDLTPDANFSGDGVARVGFGSGRQDVAYDLIEQPDDKILVVGKSCKPDFSACNFAVARLTSSGARNKAFSGDGKKTTDFGSADTAYSVALQVDGKIVVAGEKLGASSSSMALARYLSDGALDMTFSSDGKKTISFGTWAGARDVQMHGTAIVLGGSGHNGTDSDFAVARVQSGGGLDSTFSGNGKALIDFGDEDYGRALVIQSGDNKYVMAGMTDDGSTQDFAVARVLP